MSIKLSKIASFLNDTVIGNDTRVNNIVIDSRQVESGDLFVAIPGKNFDGHSFIPESIKEEHRLFYVIAHSTQKI